jgi:hypothetical protein
MEKPREARARGYESDQIVLMGESLGTIPKRLF